MLPCAFLKCLSVFLLFITKDIIQHCDCCCSWNLPSSEVGTSFKKRYIYSSCCGRPLKHEHDVNQAAKWWFKVFPVTLHIGSLLPEMSLWASTWNTLSSWKCCCLLRWITWSLSWYLKFEHVFKKSSLVQIFYNLGYLILLFKVKTLGSGHI